VGLVLAAVAVLLLMEPDFGSTVIVGCLGLVMLFAAGVRRIHLGMVLIPAICLLCLAIVTSSYRMNRVRAQWDIIMGKEQLIETVSYQTRQSLIAMGSGGLCGEGLGEGLQKYHFLSLAHSDFIFPIIGEESGFFGATFVALLFLALFIAGMRITFSCPDRFTQLLALGVTLLLTITALIHMMVAVALLPPKGLPLPFISYGGSAMLVNLAAVGILMNLAQYSDVKL
jgi:cell division protein FtsW